MIQCDTIISGCTLTCLHEVALCPHVFLVARPIFLSSKISDWSNSPTKVACLLCRVDATVPIVLKVPTVSVSWQMGVGFRREKNGCW